MIASADDALFLSLFAAAGALRGEGLDALADRAAAARREYVVARQSNPAPLFGAPPEGPPPFELLPAAMAKIAGLTMRWMAQMNGPEGPPQIDGTVIHGAPASPGIYEGPVRIVLDEHGLADVEPGDVLVCSMTNPAWSAAIATAGALVSDVGGPASHPAITARDLGIVAVVGTRLATAVLHNGERVLVDGSAGTVRRLGGTP